MCPCPICATIALLLLPFMGYKWAKNFVKKHHCSCEVCQKAEHQEHMKNHTKCHCQACKHPKTVAKNNKKSSYKKGKKHA